MSLNSTPSAERIHIAFFGKRNVGKSSLINAVTAQQSAIVSDVAGTTTDPVKKNMELLPLGPVVIIDTPGVDDVGELGELRIRKTYEIMKITDIAVLVIDASLGMDSEDKKTEEELKKRNIPYIIAQNKSDLITDFENVSENIVTVSAKKNININKLKELIAKFGGEIKSEKKIIGDFIDKKDFVILVIPIDSSAPKGRLILPQQQTIRDILDSKANVIALQPENLENVLNIMNGHIKAVVTDSQVFSKVAEIVPQNIYLTSFSVLFARYKGNLAQNIEGAKILDTLENGDNILISEGCTHHRQCEDIGTVKLPKMIKKYSGKDLNFSWTSGTEFTQTPEKYKLIVHCGGCMLNEREMKYRLSEAERLGIAMTNYGIAMAKMTGILQRCIEIFKGDY